MGRFDLAWDGLNPPKLLEYNADTPFLYIESSLAQLNWQREKYSGDYQSNFLASLLLSGFARISKKP